MAIANNIINNYKKGVDAAGIINEADAAFLATAALQNKCLFEMIIYPENLGDTANTTALDKAKTLLDPVIMRTYLYSIEDLPLFGLEYQRNGGLNLVKDLVYPDSFSCTFLENTFGAVKGYFRRWRDQIAIPKGTQFKVGSKGTDIIDYVFNDNQTTSKRTGLIIPMAADMIPSLEWIKIDGMKFKNLTGIGYDHSSGENELLTCEFSCDNIRLVSTIGEITGF